MHTNAKAWPSAANIEADALNKAACYQSTGHTFRWPFRPGERDIEVVPASGFVVDVSEAVIATLVAGGGIGISTAVIAAPYVARGELVPVLAAAVSVCRQIVRCVIPSAGSVPRQA